MKDARSATRTIWKTVVFAGAMLAVPACSKNNPSAGTTGNTGGATTTDGGDQDPCAGPDDPCGEWGDPCADPCGRAGRDWDEGGAGRGFILS